MNNLVSGHTTRKPLPGDVIWYFDGRNPASPPYPATIASVLDEGENPRITFTPLRHDTNAGPIREGKPGDTTPHYRWPTHGGAPIGPLPRVGVFFPD